MSTLSNILSNYLEFILKPITVKFEEVRRNALIFDLEGMNEEDAEEFIEDIFCDGIPESLDMEKKIPFLAVGIFEGDIAEGFNAIAQTEYLLFLDVDNASESKTPIYSIEVDGTARESSFKKICDNISELNIELGHIDMIDDD